MSGIARVFRNPGAEASVLYDMVRASLTDEVRELTDFMRGLYGRCESTAALVATGLLAVLVAVHGLFSFHPALEALYLLPVWFAFRTGGRRSGFALLALALLTASLVGLAANGETSNILLFRLVAYGLIGGAVAYTDHRLFASEEVVVPATAVNIDCDGFQSLDDAYGDGAGAHVREMLTGILYHETRESDMVVQLSQNEFVLVFEGLDALAARTEMARIQRRFEQRVHDAGYDCQIRFGLNAVPSRELPISFGLVSPSAYLN